MPEPEDQGPDPVRTLSGAAAFYEEYKDVFNEDEDTIARGHALIAKAEGVDVSITLELNEWGTLIALMIGARGGDHRSPSLEGLRTMEVIYDKVLRKISPIVEQL